MKTPRVYIDTSVLGGCFDAEFERWSNALMADFRSRRFAPLISDLLESELGRAPAYVQALFDELQQLGADFIATGGEARLLLLAYQRHAVLGRRYENDMMHIALATVAGADVLVSWNFKHMVRFDKIRQFNAVNLEQGYRALTIHSPREIATYGQDRDQGE